MYYHDRRQECHELGPWVTVTGRSKAELNKALKQGAAREAKHDEVLAQGCRLAEQVLFRCGGRFTDAFAHHLVDALWAPLVGLVPEEFPDEAEGEAFMASPQGRALHDVVGLMTPEGAVY